MNQIERGNTLTAVVMPQSLDVLVTGGTGNVGRHLVPSLLKRGHRVRVLARAASADRVPAGATAVVGDVLDANSIAAAAMRLGLVTIEQMVNALVYAVDHPPSQGERRIIDVPLIRQGRW